MIQKDVRMAPKEVKWSKRSLKQTSQEHNFPTGAGKCCQSRSGLTRELWAGAVGALSHFLQRGKWRLFLLLLLFIEVVALSWQCSRSHPCWEEAEPSSHPRPQLGFPQEVLPTPGHCSPCPGQAEAQCPAPPQRKQRSELRPRAAELLHFFCHFCFKACEAKREN